MEKNMFCEKCGKQIDDNAKACSFCGAMVDGSVNPYLNNEFNISKPAPVSSYQAQPEKRKKKTGLIIAIIAFVLVLGGGATFGHWYFHRPIMLINKAIEINDIKTVAEIFPELTDEGDIISVQRAMGSYASELEKDFINKDKDYDEVMKELKLLGKDVLKDSSKYEKIIANIEDINDSRNNFEKAEKAFEDEDYEKASELYALVSKNDDEHYKDSQDRIEEIKELMIPDVVGTWKTVIDIAPAFLSGMNADIYGIDESLLSRISFPVDIIFSFDENANCEFSFDADQFFDKFSNDMGPIMDVLCEIAAKAAGMSVSDLDYYCKLLYGEDLKTTLAKELDVNSLKREFGDLVGDGVESYFYAVEDNYIYLYRTEEDLKNGVDLGKMTLFDDKIVLEENAMYLDYNLEQCLDFPVEFEKVED